MKKSSNPVIAVMVLSGIVLFFTLRTAIAQMKKQKQSSDSALFATLDQNKDGKITRKEISESQLKSFLRLLRVGDDDKNGQLSRSEFLKALNPPKFQPQQPSPRRTPKPTNPRQIFRNLDRNKDGKLELKEVPVQARPRFQPFFDRTDKSSLTREEFVRSFRQLQQRQNLQRLQNRAQQLFTQFDRNEDGKLDIKEAPRQRKQFVRNLLKQGKKGENATLAKSEAIPLILRALQANQRTTNRRVVEFISRYDKNKDRRISKSELPDSRRQQFERLDANKDGFLNYPEIVRIVNQQAAKRPANKKFGKKKSRKKSSRKKRKKTNDKKRKKSRKKSHR